MDHQVLTETRQINTRLPRRSVHSNIKYVEVEGIFMKEIFRKSLSGMADILKSNVCNSAKHYNCIMSVEIKADNHEKLLLSFLSNIIKLTTRCKNIFCYMNITELTNTKITAQVFGVYSGLLDYEITSIVDGQCIIREDINNNKWKSSILFEVKKSVNEFSA